MRLIPESSSFHQKFVGSSYGTIIYRDVYKRQEYARSIRRLIKQMEKAALKFVLEKYKLFTATE